MFAPREPCHTNAHVTVGIYADLALEATTRAPRRPASCTSSSSSGRDRRRKRLKTPAARRDVILGRNVAALLHELEEGSAYTEPDDLVFCTAAGRPRSSGHLSNAFRAAVRRAGLTSDDRICLHGLRHRYASLLIAAGIDIVFVARRLGHGDPRTTLTTDAHYFAAADHATAARTALDAHDHSSTSGPAMETAVVTETPRKDETPAGQRCPTGVPVLRVRYFAQ